ncbi:unnamed protein product [Schistosoma margrebowiei]|uniref:RNA helicase n=1 Tax=Schistosoma margrebowiei TaxID=48269 RepID=A0A183N434_9TREM|nr:unnamed protein product [Schistosoma margrebowiei]
MDYDNVDDDIDISEARQLVKTMNRKNRKSGGFQSMGLSTATFNGIMKKGYKIPTPIQRKLGKFTPLKATVILGGDKIIATPGRFLHVLMEMNLSLNSIEYVVFDEGDRLFELGFAEQLSETLKRLPRSRQTVIFSATLPKNLVEFARAGLVDPILLRLDLNSKLSQDLKV